PDGRSHGSVRHQRTSTEELRAPGAWWFSLRASGPSFGSQRSGPESASRGTRPPGEIIPEWWATSSRNSGRDHLGIGGRHHPGMRRGFTRNRHVTQKHKAIEQPERYRREHEEVDCRNAIDMIGQKGPPALRWRPTPVHIACDDCAIVKPSLSSSP